MSTNRSYWTRSLSRRRLLRAGALGGAAALGAAVLGCGGDDETADSGDSGEGTETVKRGGSLRLGLPADISNLEVHSTNRLAHDTLFPIFDALTRYDHDLKPQPKLALSWEQSDGGATIVLKLRQGVKFHRGRDFTAEDVVWNLNRVKDPNLGNAQFRLMANWFPTIEKPDNYTLVLKSDKPRPATFDFFELFNIADSVTKGGADAATTAVGTGPWRFVEWRQGQFFKVARNPDYWDREVPYLDELTWNTALEAESMLSQFEAGGLDGVDSPSVNGFVRFQKDSRFQTYLHPSPGAYYLNGINVKNPPFNDKRVRQAFNWAADRQRFANLVLKDLVEPFSLPWPKVSLAYEEAKSNFFSFDLQKAKDLLSAANATNLRTTLITRPDQAEAVEFTAIWQNDLRSIGVEMEIQVLEPAAWGQAANNLNYSSVYAASATRAAYGSPSSLYTIVPNIWGGDGKNNTGFQNARWQELIEQATTELDMARQRAIYSELNTILLDESHLQVTAPIPWRLAVTKNVRGVTHDMQDSYDYTKAWLA